MSWALFSFLSAAASREDSESLEHFVVATKKRRRSTMLLTTANIESVYEITLHSKELHHFYFVHIGKLFCIIY